MASRTLLVVISGAKIYLTANPLRSEGRKGTKDTIATVRHLYVDFDIDGEARLTLLRTSDIVPAPTAVFATSLCKYRVSDGDGIRRIVVAIPESRHAEDPVAVHAGGISAKGNRKQFEGTFRRLEGGIVHAAEDPCDSISNPGDFPLDIPEVNALPLPHAIPSQEHPGKHTNSEHDWAWILHELPRGKDAAKLTRMIASRRSDKPRPLYYAQRTVHVASARPCLIESVPMEGVCHTAGGPPPLQDCLCTVYPKRPKQGCGAAACEEACIWGGVRRFCAGVEGMILHSIFWQCRNGASHRKNFDTPPLRGCCKALRGAP